MKIWKLVSGIVSTVLFAFVMFQSCAAGMSNALEANGEIGGSAGFILACLMLAGGIVSICTRKTFKGSIALTILFGLAALIGFTCAGSYSDLIVWSAWCLINAIVAVIAFIKGKRNGRN